MAGTLHQAKEVLDTLENEHIIPSSTFESLAHDPISIQGSTPLADLKEKNDIEAAHTSSLSTDSLSSKEASSRNEEANIVDWDGPDDPRNPQNWSGRRKWLTVALVSAITFVTPLASSMFAPGVPALMKEFHSDNDELASFVVSVYVLGLAAGPLIIAPMSELYGRLPCYHVCNGLFVIFTVACALSTNLNMLIGFRLLEGIAGSAPLTIGGGSIADVIPQEKRGIAMALFALGPLLGPVIGPAGGGYLAQAKGWRWVFWLIAIIGGCIALLSIVFMRETYAIVLLQRKAKRLRQETGNTLLKSKLDSGLSARALFILSITRPTKLLLFSPICLALSVFMAVVYGYLYLLFTTFPIVYQGQYGFSSGTVGLTYIGLGLGNLIGLGVFGAASDKILKKMSAQGEMKPEYRLPPMIYGAPFIPIGLFWYGWSAQAKTHWIVPILGTLFFGVGLLATFMCIQTYLVDAFTVYAASALAANTVLRSIFGAVLPLAGRKMYQTLGLGWGNSLLAFIALAMCPVPWIFFKYGERIRLSKPLKL